jgi:hypothetical protein
MYSINGIGTTLYGNREVDSDGSFIATKWFTIIWLSIVPLGSYRVFKGETNEAGIPTLSFGWSTQYRMQSIAINWKQIISTYICVYGSILLLIIDAVYDPYFVICRVTAVLGFPYLIYRFFGDRWWSLLLSIVTLSVRPESC